MRAQRALGTCISGLLFVGLAATGCTTASTMTPLAQNSSKSRLSRGGKVTYNYTAKDRDCLKRVMYFESEHSDHDGYMAVGTVVMNRLTSGAYPSTICGIVAQEKQFAPGVMTRVVLPQAEPDLDLAANALLRGERHPGVKDAMFFHTNGLKFPYDNMHYVAVAGGNAFYEKRDEYGQLETPAPLPGYEVAMNYVPVQTMSTMGYFPVDTGSTATNAITAPATTMAAVSPTVMASAAAATVPATTMAAQAPVLLPTQVPVPILTPPPIPASAPDMTVTASIRPDPAMPIAIPSPRPVF
ncbi:cell wall hydrolase [Neorhizobium sp. P12A]|uniref:cell wall hydrolase n=1 Tax=Neorhizobium sp. P12A TaxID=2268027 RepID=UPI0011F00356|nr:cell wall hydrolase [Neorhizobium sp. P12A]KAA0694522.1 cell wall hydrolase [Neorhizobium sp. P12A]